MLPSPEGSPPDRTAGDLARNGSVARAAFVATLSDGLRAPLHGVHGMLEMLAGTALTAEQQDCVESLRASTRSLLAVLAEVHDLAQLEEGRLSLDESPFDLATVLEAVVIGHGEDAERRGLELVLQYDTRAERRVVGDPARLQRVLGQLVSHALRATEHGVVLLHGEAIPATEGQLALQFDVRYGGPGLPSASKPAGAHPSPTDAADASRRHGRTNLGLSLLRELVHRMRGTLESRTLPGRGTTLSFRVELPSVPAEAAAAALPTWDALRALVLEPQPVCRRVLAEHLTRRGMRVEFAEDLGDATERIDRARRESDPIVLALVAQAQPRGDGLAVGRELRRSFPGRDLSLVLVGGNTTLTTASAWRTSVFDLVVGKPWTPRALFESLAAMLTEAEARRRRTAQAMPRSEAVTTRVLLVDDHPINQKVTKRMLENLGCAVTIAPNGRLGVELCSRERFDLVLMDCELPGLDGFQATRVIRTLEKVQHGRHTPIVALTSNASLEGQEACLRCGMDGFCTMPMDEPGLAQVIARYAGSGEAAA